jgi:uncharacterized protein YprB with RNaseH-like and TPR domain
MKYSKINKLRWSDVEIDRRSRWHCPEHGHSGLTHPKCYNDCHGIVERKSALDIETGNLNADFGIVLSWANKTIGGSTTKYDYVTRADIEAGTYDKRIIETLVDDLWNYDRIVTHYGNNARFDVPFIRSRYLWLVARGLYDGQHEFPGYGMLWQSDTFTMAKGKTKLSSRRQDNIASCILNKDVKTKIEKNYWMAIKYGSIEDRMKAIKYIVKHNLADVDQLADNYTTLLPYVREARTSI